MKKDLVELGQSKKPHGIKGAFLFNLYNHQESILNNKTIITLLPLAESSSIDPKGEEFEIRSIHFGNKTICYLVGVDDRNITEAMLPFKIMLPRSEFPEISEDEVYLQDLVDLKVIDTNGLEIGVVSKIYDNGAQAVLKINLKSESIELPFVENFFPEVDIQAGTITMIKPEVIE